MTAALKPLEGNAVCECGHPRSFHIHALWGHVDHDGACSAKRCYCQKFVAEEADAAAG